jgi:GntR family transcriptional regulator/MocR family aminotransferase
MSYTWANIGIDLHLEPAGRHIRAGLESGLREAIQAGRLQPGTRLPASRTLALDLGVARNTVAEAYGQLVAEGWLSARQGSGTRVSEHAVAAADGAAPATTPSDRVRYDLRPGRPDVTLFPRAAWLAAARRALARAPYDALGYGDPRGRIELREALAAYLARVRGVRATPEHIVVCSGFAQSLALLCATERSRGARSLGVEAHGHTFHREVAAATGLALTPIPVDAEGAVTSALDGLDAAVLTPAHQFPLGVPLAPERRRQAVEWARAGDRLIVEDDYDGEFRYDRQAVGAMQALAPEHIAYAGTASKSLAPGLRLGWLVVPARLLEAVVEAKRLADAGGGALDQLTLAELIAAGGYDRHIRRCRLEYQRRRAHLVAALHRGVPGARVAGVAAGLQALVELPAGLGEGAAVAAAREHGVAVEALAAYSATEEPHAPALVVGYGTPPQHAFTTAVARLCAALQAACNPAPVR